MLYREIIAVCSQIQTKYTKYTVWAERTICECYTGGKDKFQLIHEDLEWEEKYSLLFL